MSVEEARAYCQQEGPACRKVADDGCSLYWDIEGEPSFFIQAPWGYRELVFLGRDVVQCASRPEFSGALVWIQFIFAGATPIMETAWQIIENMRRAHGDLRSLELAPAQVFRQDEILNLEVALLSVMGNGWPATFVPNSDFFVEFRSSHRLFFYAQSERTLERLRSQLARWNPRDAEADSLPLS